MNRDNVIEQLAEMTVDGMDMDELKEFAIETLTAEYDELYSDDELADMAEQLGITLDGPDND
jgi:hypothetical protein